MQSEENLSVLADVANAFEVLQLRWVLGGSWASSIHGVSRFTQDADFMVEPFTALVDLFCKMFGPDYYMNQDAIRTAIRNYSTFNIVHSKLGFKADVFVVGKRPFDLEVLKRRQKVTLSSKQANEYVASAEDILIIKLEWYRLGEETSDRQWSDILGILRTQSGRLDQEYLNRWSTELNVADLLAKAQTQVR